MRTSSSRRSSRTTRCSSASCSTSPCPHSTTVTESSVGGVQVEVVDVGHAAQPVGVDVHQRHPAVAVHAGDDERRRGDRLADAEAGADALRQRGLAGPERPDQDDEVAGPQQPAEGRGPAPGCPRASGRTCSRFTRCLRRPATAAQVGRERRPRGAVRAEPDGRRGVVGRPDAPGRRRRARRPAHLRQHRARAEEPLRRRQPERDDDRRVEQLELAAQPAAAAGHLGRLRRPVARRPALHDVEDGAPARGRGRPRRAAGRAARPTSRRTAGRSRPRWRPGASPTSATRGRPRDRDVADDDVLPGRGELRAGDAGRGPRRRAWPSRARRRRCGRPRRRRRRAAADGERPRRAP